jgi:hypothetical protein
MVIYTQAKKGKKKEKQKSKLFLGILLLRFKSGAAFSWREVKHCQQQPP